MSKTDAEILSRWLDGELSPEERDAMGRDADARAAADALGRQDEALRASMEARLAPPPPALEQAVRAGFAARRKATATGAGARWWMPAAAAAAVVVTGLAVFDTVIDRRVDIALDQMRAERAADMSLLASAVQEVLEQRQSGSEAVFENASTGFSVRIVPRRTWKSASGHWCREFTESFGPGAQREPVTSTACRNAEGAWVRTRTEVESPSAPIIPWRGQDL